MKGFHRHIYGESRPMPSKVKCDCYDCKVRRWKKHGRSGEKPYGESNPYCVCIRCIETRVAKTLNRHKTKPLIPFVPRSEKYWWDRT
jgi:hypothetical protein